MCGRIAVPRKRADGEPVGESDWSDHPRDWRPHFDVRYNVGPTTQIPVVTGEGYSEMRWGLVPSWSKEPSTKYATFNAKLETAAQKPAFRSAWKNGRRCIIPIVGYYEWRTENDVKQPYFVRPSDGRLLILGGLWEQWNGAQNETINSATVLTREPTNQLAELHSRMPVMLRNEAVNDWLHGDAHQTEDIARNEVASGLEFYPVSRAVGNVRNQGAELIKHLVE